MSKAAIQDTSKFTLQSWQNAANCYDSEALLKQLVKSTKYIALISRI